MLVSSLPYKFGTPWAADAASGYLTDPIPATAAGAAASQQLGFPPLTATPVAGGGTPPNVADFNGFGNYVTAWLQWVQAGGPVAYDSVLSAAIGGYPSGARLRQALDNNNGWVSTIDNNTVDPDTVSGPDWVDPFAATLAAPGQQAISGRTILQWQTVPVTLAAGATTTVQALNPNPAFPNALLAVIANGGAFGGGAPGVFAIGANVSGSIVEYVVTNLGSSTETCTATFLLIGH